MILEGLTPEETRMIVPPNTILLGYVGSISHGTHVPSTDPNSIDDKDIMGICVGPPEIYTGLQNNHLGFKYHAPYVIKKHNGEEKRNCEQNEIQYKEWDSVIYEIQKFFGLLLKQNPNSVGLLWLPNDMYIHKTPEGDKIVHHREIFTSTKIYTSFVEYAKGQMHRMTHMNFQGYMGEKRKKLVEKFGYDVKNAAHMIRLLRMLIEFLKNGEMHVYRTKDAEELIEIKTGKWPLGRVKKESDRLFRAAEIALESCSLPKEPDYKAAERLQMEIIESKQRTPFGL